MSGSGVTPPQGLEVVEFERFACGTMPRGRVPQPPRECCRDEKSPVLRGLGHEAGFVTRMRVGLLGAPDASASDSVFCGYRSRQCNRRIGVPEFIDGVTKPSMASRLGCSSFCFGDENAVTHFQQGEGDHGSFAAVADVALVELFGGGDGDVGVNLVCHRC